MKDALTYTFEQFGDKKHSEYKELIWRALADIAANPNGPRAKSSPAIHADARILHISRPGKRARHFFLYRVAENKPVYIGRLLHDSMDLKRHLPSGFDGGDS